VQRIAHANRLLDRLNDDDEHELSYIVLFDGWVQDLLRFHASLANDATDWELVVVDNPGDDEASTAIAVLDRVVHVPLRDRVGYAAGRNLGLRLATGRTVCIVDTSVEVTGELHLQVADPDVGLLGRWGVVTANGFDFEESDGVGWDGSVDGVEAYFMALRRADLQRTGLFDPKFKFYRNADLDFSFRVRDAGLRTIVDPTLPLARHEHRLWENTPDRDELSRRNFARFRQHWGERTDLLTRR
jgi:GT2 family glycosyltransferase